DLPALVACERLALAGGAADEGAAHAVGDQRLGLAFDEVRVQRAVRAKGGEGGGEDSVQVEPHRHCPRSGPLAPFSSCGVGSWTLDVQRRTESHQPPVLLGTPARFTSAPKVWLRPTCLALPNGRFDGRLGAVLWRKPAVHCDDG